MQIFTYSLGEKKYLIIAFIEYISLNSLMSVYALIIYYWKIIYKYQKDKIIFLLLNNYNC